MVQNGINSHGHRNRARTEDEKSIACFTNENPIFDALYELENEQAAENNGVGVQEDEDTAAQSQLHANGIYTTEERS